MRAKVIRFLSVTGRPKRMKFVFGFPCDYLEFLTVLLFSRSFPWPVDPVAGWQGRKEALQRF